MRYDFDMFSTFPDEIRQQFQGQLNELGVGHMTGTQIALFRHPETANALRSADKDVQQLFLDAGFGMNCENKPIPEGRYLARDAQAHERCVLNFMHLATKRMEALAGSNWGGINPVAFVEATQTFQPIDEIDLQRSAAGRQVSGRKVGAAIVFLLGSSLLVGATLIYLVQKFFLN